MKILTSEKSSIFLFFTIGIISGLIIGMAGTFVYFYNKTPKKEEKQSVKPPIETDSTTNHFVIGGEITSKESNMLIVSNSLVDPNGPKIYRVKVLEETKIVLRQVSLNASPSVEANEFFPPFSIQKESEADFSAIKNKDVVTVITPDNPSDNVEFKANKIYIDRIN